MTIKIFISKPNISIFSITRRLLLFIFVYNKKHITVSTFKWLQYALKKKQKMLWKRNNRHFKKETTSIVQNNKIYSIQTYGNDSSLNKGSDSLRLFTQDQRFSLQFLNAKESKIFSKKVLCSTEYESDSSRKSKSATSIANWFFCWT